MEIEDKLSELENRITYLEQEVDVSYKTHEFNRKIEHIVEDRGESEVEETDFGHFARVTGIDGDDLQHMVGQLDAVYEELDYAITETSEGLGVEIWDEPEF